MDMSQYHNLFVSETREHLNRISQLAVQLEADRNNQDIIGSLFRSAHSVKGMAASMGFTAIAELAHKMEDLMDRVRRGMQADAALFDLLLAGEERLSAMVDQLGSGSEVAADDLIARIIAYNPAGDGEPTAPAGDGEVDRPAVEAAPAVADAVEPVAAVALPGSSVAQQTVKVKTALLDSFLDTTGELITVKHRLAMFARSMHNQALAETVDSLGRHLRDLHDQVMAVRLFPLEAITERFPRMVRDLARNSHKEITFAMSGTEIELDRSILEVLGDPLAHILRNSVDHGIETPAERTAAGKAATGSVTVSVARIKDQVEILIEDDGRGIDPERIAATAVQKGFISREKAACLENDDKLMLICHAGFSTADRITEVSGRGVGMDVVRTTIHSLGGTLAISSTPGKGSCFALRLPLTIAIINVLLVKVGKFTLAIPLTAVNRTLDLKREEITVVEGREVFFLDDEAVPIFQLGRVLNMQTAISAGETIPLFVTEFKGRKAALKVDKLLGHQDIFVKPLLRPLSGIEGLCGASVLGDGEVVFILDIVNRFL